MDDQGVGVGPADRVEDLVMVAPSRSSWSMRTMSEVFVPSTGRELAQSRGSRRYPPIASGR